MALRLGLGLGLGPRAGGDGLAGVATQRERQLAQAWADGDFSFLIMGDSTNNLNEGNTFYPYFWGFLYKFPLRKPFCGHAIGTSFGASFPGGSTNIGLAGGGATQYVGNAQTAVVSDVIVSQITRSGTTATLTVSFTSHFLNVGQTIVISGCTQPEYNGTFTVATVPTSTTFTYTMSGTPAASPATGSPVCRIYLKNSSPVSILGYFQDYRVKALGNGDDIDGTIAHVGPTVQITPINLAAIMPKKGDWAAGKDFRIGIRPFRYPEGPTQTSPLACGPGAIQALSIVSRQDYGGATAPTSWTEIGRRDEAIAGASNPGLFRVETASGTSTVPDHRLQMQIRGHSTAITPQVSFGRAFAMAAPDFHVEDHVTDGAYFDSISIGGWSVPRWHPHATEEKLRQYISTMARPATHVLHWLGLNDTSINDAWRDQVREIGERIEATETGAIPVLVIPPASDASQMSKFVTIRAYYEGLRAEKGWPIVDLDATLGRHLVAVVELQDGVHQNLAGSIVGVQTFDAWAAGKAPLETKNIVQIANTAFASGNQAAFTTQQATVAVAHNVITGALATGKVLIMHLGSYLDLNTVSNEPVVALNFQPQSTAADAKYRLIFTAVDGRDGFAPLTLASYVTAYDFDRDTVYNIRAGCDTNTGEGFLRVNGADVHLTEFITTGTIGTVDVGTNQVSNGASGVHTVADLWGAIDFYDDTANLFYTAAGAQKYKGWDGSAISGGVVPLVYLPNVAADFGMNAGSSDDLTLFGSFTDV